MDDLLTTKQLMDLLHLDRTTIYRMLNDGRLPAVRVGGQWRFSRQVIEAWLQGRILPAAKELRAQAENTTAAPGPSTDILPLHCLQPIQEVFAQTADIGSVTTDLSGQPVTTFSNPSAFCNLILASEKGHARCQASWKRLAERTELQPRLEKCHAGLTYARARITVQGEFIAMIFGGQFAVGKRSLLDSQEHIAEIANACEVDEDDLRKAAQEIPDLERKRANQLLHLLQLVADTFSSIGQERLDLLTRLKRVAELADMAPR